MGLLDLIFKPFRGKAGGFFKTLTAYSPAWTSWGGRLYESELVRAAIDVRARHISKLKAELVGSAQPRLQTRLRQGPNEWQTWSQWMYRLSTILDMQNTAFIVPVFDDGAQVVGYYPILPSRCELVTVSDEIGVRYQFSSGDWAMAMLNEVGIMTKFQYSDDFFGSSNQALNTTMQLLHIQSQGVENAVKNSATYRFMARLNNFSRHEDIAQERKRFTRENLVGDGGGILLFPNTYTDVKQIETKPYTIAAAEMEYIRSNVYNYFGVNADVIQNKALGDQLDAFFNGAIEPFAIQLSEVMSKLIFTERERSAGARFLATANRIQYMSVDKKISMAKEMGDRGMLMIDEVRELLNYPPLPNGQGQKATIRGEYYFVGEKKEKEKETEENE